MSIYKPAKSKYWHFDFQQHGCRHHGSTGCTPKREAERYEAEQRRKAALGEKVKPTITLDDACGVWWLAKGQRPHTFPLTPRLAAIIANQPKACPQVFSYVAEADAPARGDRVRRIKGQRYPFSKQGWDRKWRRALKDAGIEGYCFHDNRHTAATRTESIEAANRLLGHSDIRTTMRYFHTSEEAVRKAMIAAESRNITEPTQASPEKARKSANDQ